jgi:hypothetical protein
MGRSTLTIWVLLLGWLWMQPVLAQHSLLKLPCPITVMPAPSASRIWMASWH